MQAEKIYDKLAEGYDLRQNNPTTDIVRKKELKLLKQFVSGDVVDIGCGTGYHLEQVNCPHLTPNGFQEVASCFQDPGTVSTGLTFRSPCGSGLRQDIPIRFYAIQELSHGNPSATMVRVAYHRQSQPMRNLPNHIYGKVIYKCKPSQIHPLPNRAQEGDFFGTKLKGGFGIDISKKMIKVAKEKGLKKLIIGDGIQTPLRNESFETILVMFGTLNFCDWRKTIKEAYRLLKLKGRIIVSVASEFDNGYSFWEKLNKIRPKERWIGIQKKKFRMKLFGKNEIVGEFRRKGFRLEHFDSALIYFKPRWGDFTPLNLKERFQLLLETILPLKDFGCIYFFVFRKV